MRGSRKQRGREKTTGQGGNLSADTPCLPLPRSQPLPRTDTGEGRKKSKHVNILLLR